MDATNSVVCKPLDFAHLNMAKGIRGFCKKNNDITVHLRGGKLIINYSDEGVFMTGSAVKVFEGEIEV